MPSRREISARIFKIMESNKTTAAAVTDFLTANRISRFRTASEINQANKNIFVGVSMVGDSLKHLGIFHGDILIVKLTKNFNEENLYVWNVRGEKTAKFARTTLAEITLHNRGDYRETFSRSDISMLGAVVRIERALTVKR